MGSFNVYVLVFKVQVCIRGRYRLKSGSYVHLWSTAPQQVNEGRVEGHDGVPQVDLVLLVLLLSSKPGQQISQSGTRETAPIILPFVSSFPISYCT